jgi:hypothetical protein
VLILGTVAGCVEIWDICKSVVSPAMVQAISDHPITCIVLHIGGHQLSAADSKGNIYVVSLPEIVQTPYHRERSAVVSLLEREFQRQRSKQTGPAKVEPPTLPQEAPTVFGAPEDSVTKEIIDQVGTQYLSQVEEDLDVTLQSASASARLTVGLDFAASPNRRISAAAEQQVPADYFGDVLDSPDVESAAMPMRQPRKSLVRF